MGVQPDIKLQAADFTDENWIRGCAASDDIVLLDYTDTAVLYLLQKREKIICAGRTLPIKSIEYDEEWIRIVVDGDASICRYPAEFRVE